MQKYFEVLHVEDEEAAARVTADVLRHFNPTWRVERVARLELALGLLVANPDKFGLVILDLRLPGIAGLEGLKRIMQIAPHMCVVIYTATVDVDIEDAAFEYGAQSYIYKPCDSNDLYRKINRAVVRFYGTLERCKPEPLPAQHRSFRAILLDNKAKAGIITGAILAIVGGLITAAVEWFKAKMNLK
jgi:DNA-binding NtrC family response regulator